MSDNENPESGAAAGAAGQEAPLTIHTQYVKDLSFENPGAPGVLAAMKEQPSLDVRLDAGARHIQERLYEVILKVHATATVADKTAFVCEVEYGALASIGKQVPEDQVQPLLLIEGPRVIFPFARRVLADATRDGGFPPVLVNPIDFVDLYRKRQQQAAEAQAANSGAEAGEA